jgi:hypothetical protein
MDLLMGNCLGKLWENWRVKVREKVLGLELKEMVMEIEWGWKLESWKEIEMAKVRVMGLDKHWVEFPR